MSYKEALLDPRWQRKRLEILNRDEFTCRDCDCKDVTLHVHHEYYVKGRQPWQYPDWSLKTMCKDCHAGVGRLEDDEVFSPSEWEMELEFALDSDSRNSGLIWDVSVEMVLAYQRGCSVRCVSDTLAQCAKNLEAVAA